MHVDHTDLEAPREDIHELHKGVVIVAHVHFPPEPHQVEELEEFSFPDCPAVRKHHQQTVQNLLLLDDGQLVPALQVEANLRVGLFLAFVILDASLHVASEIKRFTGWSLARSNAPSL